MLDRSGSGDSCGRKGKQHEAYRTFYCLKIVLIIIVVHNLYSYIINARLTLHEVESPLVIQHHTTNPELPTRSICGMLFKTMPLLTLNLQRPPMSSLLSKQTGSRPSSTQIFIQARPELPAPTTATRRTIAEHLCSEGHKKSEMCHV